MNKKISTLLTSALLVGSVAANAQWGTVDAVSSIEQLANGSRYYVLSTDGTPLSRASQTLVKAAYVDG